MAKTKSIDALLKARASLIAQIKKVDSLQESLEQRYSSEEDNLSNERDKLVVKQETLEIDISDLLEGQGVCVDFD